MSCNQMLGIHNATARLRTVRIEPWARHFLLGPDEKLEIIARATRRRSRFRIVEANDTTLIYTEGCDKVRVVQDGTTHDLLPVYAIDVETARSTRTTDNPMFDRYIDGTEEIRTLRSELRERCCGVLYHGLFRVPADAHPGRLIVRFELPEGCRHIATPTDIWIMRTDKRAIPRPRTSSH
jgi:hypothetical protein